MVFYVKRVGDSWTRDFNDSKSVVFFTLGKIFVVLLHNGESCETYKTKIEFIWKVYLHN
jgi:hypothetical protein